MFDRPGDHRTMEGRNRMIWLNTLRSRNEFCGFARFIGNAFHFTTTDATPHKNHTTNKAQSSSKAAMKAQISEDTSQDNDSSWIFGNQMVTYTKSPIKPASYNTKDPEKYDQDNKDNSNNDASFKKITHIYHRIA